MSKIHPLAYVHPKAQIGDNCEIGPFSYIGENVILGDENSIANNVTITGWTTIGTKNYFYPYTVIGTPPQDLGYRGEATLVIIGSKNVFREFVSVNRATTKQNKLTTIGDSNYFMAYCHIAHDCEIGSNIVMANAVNLGGHVKVGDYAWFGGVVAVHHLVTIGDYAFITGFSRILQDCPPFLTTDGRPARPRCVNVIGLKRRGFTPEQIRPLEDAYRILYRSSLPLHSAIERVESEQNPLTREVKYLLQCLKQTLSGKDGRAREILRSLWQG